MPSRVVDYTVLPLLRFSPLFMDDTSQVVDQLSQIQSFEPNADARRPRKFSTTDVTATYMGHRTIAQSKIPVANTDEEILKLVPDYTFMVDESHKSTLFISAHIIHAIKCPIKPTVLIGEDFDFLDISQEEMKLDINQQRAIRRKRFALGFGALRKLILSSSDYAEVESIHFVDPLDLNPPVGAEAKHWESDGADASDKEEISLSQRFDDIVDTGTTEAQPSAHDTDRAPATTATQVFDPIIVSHNRSLNWPELKVLRWDQISPYWTDYINMNNVPTHDLDPRSSSIQLRCLQLMLDEVLKCRKYYHDKARAIWKIWKEAKPLRQSLFDKHATSFDQAIRLRNDAYFAGVWGTSQRNSIKAAHSSAAKQDQNVNSNNSRSRPGKRGSQTKRTRSDTQQLGSPPKQRSLPTRIRTARQESRAQVSFLYFTHFRSFYLLLFL